MYLFGVYGHILLDLSQPPAHLTMSKVTPPTNPAYELVETVEEEETQFIECRVCLQNTSEAGGCHLSATVVDSDKDTFLSLQDILTQICMVDVAPDDGLPDVVCDGCRDSLMVAYRLQLLAQQSDALLRERHSTGVKVEGKDSPGMLFQDIIESPEDNNNDEEEEEVVEHHQQHDDCQTSTELERGEMPRSQKPGRKYPECDVCGKQFSKASYLNRHKSVHIVDPNRPFQCPICYKRFHIEVTLKLHRTVHDQATANTTTTTPDRTTRIVYQCQDCDHDFATLEAFDEHCKVHATTTEAATTLYQVEDVDIEEMEEGETVVEEEEEEEEDQEEEVNKVGRPIRRFFTCDCCGARFDSINVLGAHTQASHPREATQECKICGLGYSLAAHLAEHMILHRNVKKYACTDCDKSFRLANSLEDHQRTHKNERAFLCSECGKGFFRRSNLRQHMLRHSNEKKYVCDQCPGRFATKASLTSHLRIHSGDKPYQCPHCDSAFATHFSWSKHKRVHSGEKPYVCEICGMRFNSSYHVTVGGN